MLKVRPTFSGPLNLPHTSPREMPMSDEEPILVTGAAGSVGAVGRTVVEALRRRNLPVRALVRREDNRAEALRAVGAQVVIGDLTHAADVAHALVGGGRT